MISEQEFYLTWRGPDWASRWRNELSPDQRCWTPGKVQHKRRVSFGRQVRSAPPCPCPVQACPSLDITSWDSRIVRNMKLPQRAVLVGSH
ncbi:hypothetical protein ElyMa_002382000 [Elysia marginata]|uniref:Uncharacterized protein n=1 Tax=Elysia marginata TaxID=1093978 RepID=A0AAV4GCJ7_9GAST|nr:hypothetical protein ElyMa_002382000 [Elysia marginata]